MKTGIRTNKLFASLLALAVLASVALSQTTEYTKNTADQTLRSTGRVNPSSLGLEMSIPLGSYPGRGITIPIGLSYSSKVWRLEEHSSILLNGGSTNVYVNALYSENAAAGWSSSFSQPYIEYTDDINHFDGHGNVRPEIYSPGQYDPGGHLYVKRITVYLPGGESHELRAGNEPVSIDNELISEEAWNGIYYSVDGSGIKYIQDNTTTPKTYKLLMPDGSRFDFSNDRESKNTYASWIQVRRATSMSDLNGNSITFNAPATGYPNGSITDQLGRTFPIMIPRETPTLPSTEQVLEQPFVLPGMNSSTPYILRWKRLKGDSAANSALTTYATPLHYTGNTNGNESATYSPPLFYSGDTMGCSLNHLRFLAGDLFNPVVLAEVVLPNGALYKFTYNEYGEIDEIHYPSGGHEEIEYQAMASLAQMSKPYLVANRGVKKREIFENDSDSTVDTWTYSAASSANQFRTSVVAPDGTQTDRFMHRGLPEPPCVSQTAVGARDNLYGRRWGYDNVLAGMPFEERSFSSTGQLLKRTLTRWTASDTSTVMTGSPQRYAQINARTLSTESIVYDGDAGLSSATALEYDTDQNAPGSPLNVVKTTEYGYKAVSGGSSFSPATSTTVPDASVPTIADPTVGATAVRTTETTYLQSDPNYTLTKSNYLDANLVKLVTSTRIKNGAGTTTVAQSEIRYDDSGYGNGHLGQPTTIRKWLDTTSSWLETKTKYDTYGNIVEVTDPRLNKITTTYDSTYNAFPVQVTSPIPSDGTYGSNVAFITSTAYNMTTGLPTSTTDANNQTTQISYNDPSTGALDPLLRVRKVTEPNGRQTITEYGAGTTASTRFVKTRSQIDGTNWKESSVWYDGLGRTVKSQAVDSNGDIIVETQYDNMSRPYKVTNPYRLQTVSPFGASEPIYWTESVFDTAGRPWKTITPDNAVVETTYSIATTGSDLGTAVTVKDQSLKLRRSITNALGQLIRVDEPNNAGLLGAVDSPNQPTSYTYDLLNNLAQVQQLGDSEEECRSTPPCSQTRSFQYDSLSRLKQATNPESGTIQYTYDANNNLQTKTDARGVVTTYAYDALNRVKTRTYAAPSGLQNYQATPNVSYYYDNVTNAKGKLIKVTNGTGANLSTTEYVSFDILGRVTRSTQTTDGVTFGGGGDITKWMTYTYNLSGALVEQQYPSGRVVKNVIDNDGALAEVQSKKNASQAFWKYADRFTYNAAGAATGMQLGNGRWESTQFNSRLQPTQIALGRTQGAADILKLDYQYGDLDWDGSVIAGSNNGNVAKQTITVAAVGGTPGFTAVQNYDYDALNRIQIASETLTPTTGTSESWVQEFKYDRYGNRTFNESTTTTLPKECGTAPNLTVCPGVVPIVNPSANPSNNKLTGYTFDDAGNTTQDAENRKFTYDAENKQTKVETVSGTTVTGTVGEYWYDGEGKRIKKRAYESGAAAEETIFVYDASGKLVGEYSNEVASSQDAEVAYLTNDHLGSPRINTDINGNVTARHDYHPFGEEIASSKRVEGLGYADDTIRKQFTGYERDGETELDFARARFHNFNIGRFTSIDPLIASGRPQDPQTWNRYLYVLNNPLRFVDPTGLSEEGGGTKIVHQERQPTIQVANLDVMITAEPSKTEPPKEMVDPVTKETILKNTYDISVTVTDSNSQQVPAKVQAVGLDDNGKPYVSQTLSVERLADGSLHSVPGPSTENYSAPGDPITVTAHSNGWDNTLSDPETGTAQTDNYRAKITTESSVSTVDFGVSRFNGVVSVDQNYNRTIPGTASVGYGAGSPPSPSVRQVGVQTTLIGGPLGVRN